MQKRQRLMAIVNSGFPEARQNDTALGICHRFAAETGIEWAGGFALGGGQGMIAGRPLSKLGGRVRSIMKALDLTANGSLKVSQFPSRLRISWQNPCNLYVSTFG